MKAFGLRKTSLLTTALILLAPLLYLNSNSASALTILARSAQLTTNEASAVADYDIQFTIQQLNILGSIRLEFCSNNPIPGDPCTPPAGFDASGTTIASQSGETGFSIHGSSTANDVILTRAAVVPVNTNLRYVLDSITNPSAVQTTYFMRITTHSTTDGTGTIIDQGGVAIVTSDEFDITLFVPPYLSFCVAETIVGLNCLTASGNRINFGELSNTSAKTDSAQFVVTTNAAFGYNVSITGPTMTSGIHTISRNTSPALSTPGTPQFGLNLRDNGAPNIGVNPSGLLTGGPTANYNIVDRFTYNSGDIIASSGLPDASAYTSSFIVNVPSDQNPGVYTTTLTYIAFATF